MIKCDVKHHNADDADIKNITENGKCLFCLWSDLGDIPLNEEEEIDVDFHIWGKGTGHFEIWHWFDEQIPVHKLMKL